MSVFISKDELKRVFDRLFTELSRDSEIGPRLRARKTPQRFVFSDMDLVLNVRDSGEKSLKKGDHLEWVWGDKGRTWEPVVSMTMTSDVANRYFQGRENVPLAIARGVIVLETGDLGKVLDLLPIIKPFHKKWIMVLKTRGLLHLLA